MAEEDVLRGGRERFHEEGGRVGVGRMSCARGNTPFQACRIFARAQHIGVVVRFDNDVRGLWHECLHFGQELAHVGQQQQARAVAAVDKVAHVVCAVVRHMYRRDGERFDANRLAHFDAAAQGFGHGARNVFSLKHCLVNLIRGIDGQVHHFGRPAHAPHVVGVLVGEQNGGDVFRKTVFGKERFEVAIYKSAVEQ